MQTDNIKKALNISVLENIKTSNNDSKKYENNLNEILDVIKELLFNKNLYVNTNAFKPEITKPKLNIYIAYDNSLLGPFNDVINNMIKEDVDSYKIIIGSNIESENTNSILKIKKEEFSKRINEIAKIIETGIKKLSYSEINLNYIHYTAYNKFTSKKIKLFPFAFNTESTEGCTYSIKGNLEDIIKGLMTFYIVEEIKYAEHNSSTSGNLLKVEVERN